MIWYIDMMHFSWVLACWTRQIVEYQHALMVQHQAMRKPENEWYGVIQNVLIKSWHFLFGMETGRVWKMCIDSAQMWGDLNVEVWTVWMVWTRLCCEGLSRLSASHCFTTRRCYNRFKTSLERCTKCMIDFGWFCRSFFDNTHNVYIYI